MGVIIEPGARKCEFGKFANRDFLFLFVEADENDEEEEEYWAPEYAKFITSNRSFGFKILRGIGPALETDETEDYCVKAIPQSAGEVCVISAKELEGVE